MSGSGGGGQYTYGSSSYGTSGSSSAAYDPLTGSDDYEPGSSAPSTSSYQSSYGGQPSSSTLSISSHSLAPNFPQGSQGYPSYPSSSGEPSLWTHSVDSGYGAPLGYGIPQGNYGFGGSFPPPPPPRDYGSRGSDFRGGDARSSFDSRESSRGGYDGGRGRSGYDRGGRGSYGAPRAEPSGSSFCGFNFEGDGQFVDSLDTVYFSGGPTDLTEDEIAERFGSIGILKIDKKTTKPKITIYRDKMTQLGKGDGTVTYDDPEAAKAAIDWFNNKEFRGSVMKVEMAKKKDPALFQGGRGRGRGRGGFRGGGGDRGGAPRPGGDEGDWACQSCGNVNWARRNSCNRCNTMRADGGGGDQGGGGYGGGGGGSYGGGGRGGPPNPQEGDWTCTGCGNMNWARRSSCNKCNAPKPGGSGGSDRGRDDRRDDRGRDDRRDSRRDSGRDRIKDDRGDRRERPY